MSAIIAKTYGAVLLGSLIATFLSGMNTLQTILYFRLYPKDSVIIKTSVATVFSLDIVHTAFIWVGVWWWFIINIGNIPAIDIIQSPEIVPGTIVITTVTMFMVHVFYIQRIFRLSQQNYWICVPIVSFPSS
ncbi:hypothetical protein JOM56_015257 [Amanita muscaria]